jgi:S-DNA-T family DNA segregation ATPase FtsK/SpoIIIE
MWSVRVTVSLGDGQSRNVQLDADPRAAVGDLIERLCGHLELPGRAGALYCERLGTVPATTSLRRSGLRDGDVVSLHPFPRAGDTSRGAGLPVAELVVTGGPGAGTRIALTRGEHVVGRDGAAADVTLEDPSLSRAHALIRLSESGDVHIFDRGSSNGTAVEGIALGDEGRRLGPEEQVQAGRSSFVVVPWRPPETHQRAHARGPQIPFDRPPRIIRTYEVPSFSVEVPPPGLHPARLPLAVTAAPVAMALAGWAVTDSPLMLAMGAVSPLMALSTYLSGRRAHADVVSDFEQRLAALAPRLAEAKRLEIAERRSACPDAGELALRAQLQLPTLWERRSEDRDFLELRVGVADQPSLIDVVVRPTGDPQLREQVETGFLAERMVPALPVAVSLPDVDALGLVGDMQAREGLARWLMVQIATLHSPRDVVIAAAVSAARVEQWDWLSWLPHTRDPTSPIDGSHIAVGPGAARELIVTLADIARQRREEPAPWSGALRRRTHVALLIDEDVAPGRPLVDEVIEDCGQLDISVIWMARQRRDLPGRVGAIAELESERAAGNVSWVATGRQVRGMNVDGVSLTVAENIARDLAPVRDVTAGRGANHVPRHVPLLELLGLVEPTREALLTRWERNSRGQHLEAILGAAAEGAFSIDLYEHGPHVLVAGATGSGKSELLRSLIASLAATHPPDRLTFLLIDYKGGAAFSDCVNLPHCLGAITDLDEHEVWRALISLNAELKRRENLLRAANATDLHDLVRRDLSSAPPTLVIAIDEFATLAKEVPEFIDGVVNVAQRGRSLGVHLVLATQTPGAATQNIRANMGLRLALRVSSEAESDDVLGTTDAARLSNRTPGRAIARTRADELTVFQVGFAGGRSESPGTRVRDLHLKVPHDAGRPPDEGSEDASAATDLALLVAAARAAASVRGVPTPPLPLLPALPDVVSLSEIAGMARTDDPNAFAVVTGLVDEPHLQRRSPHVVDFEADGNLLVYGTAGAGKTTFLRTVAAAIAITMPPSEVHIYGLDFAGDGLSQVEALPHCGSIVAGNDDERVIRLLKLLRRTITERKRRFAELGVHDLSEVKAARPDEVMPRVVVLLDSYGAFQDRCEMMNLGAQPEALAHLMAEGRTAGVHFVVTADRRMAVPTSVSSIVPRRLLLRLVTEDDYALFGLNSRVVRGARLPPGRGFLEDGRAVQCALLGAGTQASARAAMTDLGAELTLRHPERTAPPVLRMPTNLPRETLPGPSRRLAAVLGVEDVQLAPVELNLDAMHAVISGPYRSGRSTALCTVALSLAASPLEMELHLLAPRRSPAVELDIWTSVSRGTEACGDRVHSLLEAVHLRAEDADHAPIVILIDDAGELADASFANALETIVRRGRDNRMRVVAAFESSQARHYASWIRETRKDHNGLLLDPNPEIDGELLGVRLPRQPEARFPAGRGYLVSQGIAQLVQVAS